MPRFACARVCAAIAATLVLVIPIAPQARQARSLQPQDYGRWEQLSAQPTPLSPDGRWLVYGITRASRQNELHVRPADGGEAVVLPFGQQPAFSSDSQWLAWSIGMSEEAEARLRRERKPAQRKLGLLDLSTGTQTTVDGVESFTFSPSGTHLAFRRYAPEPASGASGSTSGSAPAADETIAPGTTLVVRELATGRDTTFGHVSEMAWQDPGSLLAFAVTVDGGVGNGIQLLDTATGMLRILDSSSSTYSGLAWRKDSASLAALRSQTGENREGPTHVVLAWPDAAADSSRMQVLDASANGLDTDHRVVRFRAPSWSEDGARIYVGVAPWPTTPVRPDAAALSRRVAATSADPDTMPDVQVWHPRDTRVMPQQRLTASADKRRSMLAAWWLDTDGSAPRLVRAAEAIGEEATPVPHQARALVVDTNAFAMERSIGRIYANVWITDLATGERSAPVTRIEDRHLRTSPAGRYLIYARDGHYWTMNVATGRQTNITSSVKTSFIDVELDDTGPHKPPFGIAGWTRDDEAVLLYDKHDVWELSPEGTSAVRLTNGAADGIRHRYVRLDASERFIDRSQPVVVSTFGLRSKKSGYAHVAPGAPSATSVTSLVWMDKRVDRLARAKNADRYAYAVQAFDDSPDYFVAGAALSEARQVSATNPFMSEYAWGRGEVMDYKSAKGQALQASVFYPAGYEPGKRYPVIVYMYERLSDGVHNFSMPDERQYYNPAAFTTRGYVYLQPDIAFTPRQPGVSVVESVVPAVQRLVQMGVADAARVGTLGHSWGGFDSVYLATHTDTFAAAVAGAPITNLISNYGNHHWSSGIAETDHIETGQQRMLVPLYEDLQAYIRNSAVFKAHTMKTPLLVMFGDNDGTVHWHQGVELYNIARRAGTNVVLLQYGGEDHGLRQRANQVDYHHRIFEWFGHYLRGEPAAEWITKGEPFLERERDLRRRKLPAPQQKPQ